MFSSLWADLRSLLMPPTCPVCGGELPPTREVVCSLCEATAPLTNLWLQPSNPMMERFWGLLPVQHASALVWYVEGSPWREAVHRFKYSGRWLTAYRFGRWYGALMRESGLYADVDVVVPVPLHFWRRMWRGYNQSEYIARGIARELGVEVDTHSVKRHRYNPSQTRQHPARRVSLMDFAHSCPFNRFLFLYRVTSSPSFPECVYSFCYDFLVLNCSYLLFLCVNLFAGKMTGSFQEV